MQKIKVILPKGFPFIAMVAGSLLALHYVLQLIYGLQTGRILWEDMGSVLGKLDGPIFTASFATLDLALLALALVHYKQLNKLKFGVFFFGLVAFLCALTGFFASLFSTMVAYVMPVACLSMFVSAILLSISSFKAQVLPVWIRYALLAFGLFTAPLGFAFPFLQDVVPLYILFELHFLPMGILWICLGSSLVQKSSKESLVVAKA